MGILSHEIKLTRKCDNRLEVMTKMPKRAVPFQSWMMGGSRIPRQFRQFASWASTPSRPGFL